MQSRAVVAYGCLFSDLRYNCNTCTQVAHTEIMLILRKKLVARLQSVLGLGVDVRLVEPRSIERSVGKAKRVIDNRKL